MQRRITLWAIAGFAIAFLWGVVLAAAGWVPSTSFLWTIIDVTCPAAIVGRLISLKFYSALALNAVIYSLIGLAVELLRRRFAPQASH